MWLACTEQNHSEKLIVYLFTAIQWQLREGRMKSSMKSEIRRIYSTEASTNELLRKQSSASATIFTGSILRSFNLNDADSLACPPHSKEVHQLIRRSSTQTRRVNGRCHVNGNGKRRLQTLLFEFLAVTATATTAATAVTAVTTPAVNTTTALATKGTQVIPFNDATGSTATASIVTNSKAFTAMPATMATALNAKFHRATTANAFIQMNSIAFGDDPLASSAGVGPTTPVNTNTVSMLDISVATTPTTITTTATTISAVSSMDAYLVALPWPKALAVAIFVLLILVTVVGNTLVILSVLTTRRLRTVTNCFVMNLAITDWLVGTCVMPPAVMVYVVGSWHYGWILCDIWISLDVLLCTGSILSLCAISLDRYLAVTQPLTYSKKRRSKRLALFMIFIVWVTALLITCPPYLGWYEQGRRREGNVDCRYNQNKGYVVFSAMGSFFIPLAVMMYVYLKIGYVLTSRRQRIVRDANSERAADHDIDCDNFISESEHYQCATPKFPSFKSRWGSANAGSNNCSGKNLSLHCSKCNKAYLNNANGSATINGALSNSVVVGGLKHQPSFYELVEVSHLTSVIQCTAISCKYTGICMHSSAVGVPLAERRSSSLPMQAVHFVEDTTSLSENCLAATTASMTTTQSMKFGQVMGQNQQHLHAQHQHNHHHHPHRIPMRVSTTKRDTKTAKTLTIVMGGFIACWLPFFVYYLLMPFLPRAAVFQGLMSFLTWVGWVNCAINPFIYAFYNPDFRTAFWRLTCRRICKQKPPPNHIALFRG